MSEFTQAIFDGFEDRLELRGHPKRDSVDEVVPFERQVDHSPSPWRHPFGPCAANTGVSLRGRHNASRLFCKPPQVRRRLYRLGVAVDDLKA